MQKKVFPVLFATLLLDMIGIGMLVPIIPILFTDPSSPSFLLHGYSHAMQYMVVGIITALFSLVQFFAAPFLGELSDIYGRKRLLTLGVGVLALSQFAFGFGIEFASLWILFASRAIAGFAAANFSIAQASIADITEPKDRAKNFGLMGAAFGIGFILGPILGGYLASFFGSPSAPFWCAGVLGLLNVVFISLFLPETRKHVQKSGSFHILKGIHNIITAARDKDARPAYLASFLYISGFSFFVTFVGAFLVSKYSLSEASLGTFFGGIGFWIVVTQLFILRIISGKFSERSILRFTLPALSLTLLAYPFMPNLLFQYLLIPFAAIPQGLSIANISALISKSVSSEKQGAALGINGSLMALANGIVPLVAGFASGFIGITTPFLAASIFILSAWSVLFIFSPRRS